jgi:phosphoglycerate dehydrogenase-like enzyme
LARTLFSTTELSQKQIEILRRTSSDIVIETGNEPELGNVEILLISDNAWLTIDRIQKMKRLKFIQTLWAGVDFMNFDIIPEGITVCGNVGGFSEPIAEHVFGMIISLARNLLDHDRDLRQSLFDRSKMGIFLKGKKMCILGTGGIGQAVARIAKAFGMVTLGVNTDGRGAPFFDRTTSLSKVDELLKEANFVVIALPLTIHTKNLFDLERLNLLPRDCILVNVGRAKIIDQSALYRFLLSHPTTKFATDVWWRYPSKEPGKFSQDYPFFDLPNFTGSPHDADIVPEANEIALDNAVMNIARYLKHETLRGIAKKSDYLGLNEQQ